MTQGSGSPEAQFLQHLEHIRRVARFTARRVGLSIEEAEECTSWAQLRLIEGDYLLVRKYRGESSFKTYITVVVVKLVRDYRVQLFGRWRPSAAAARLGPVAVRLERLLHRDGFSFEQAVQSIRASDPTAPSERELRDLLRKLPARPPLRPRLIDIDASTEERAKDRSDGTVDANERAELRDHVLDAMRAELGKLSSEDRLVLLRYAVDGDTVANIARTLGLLQRPLYDRLHSLRSTLRHRLRGRGISDDDIRGLTGDDDDV